MSSAKQPARYAVLGVVCAIALSGAARARSVSAHARAAAPPVRPFARSARPPDSVLTAPPAAPADNPSLYVPAGDYLPFYRGRDDHAALRVHAFELAARPVSIAEFAGFVRANPAWRRSRVQRLFAEASYLSNWQSDVDPAPEAASAPITNISWFAAKAYCKSIGLRLPTTVEWEHALQVIGPAFSVRTGGGAITTPVASLWEWTSDFNSIPLAGDASESVTNLFCGAAARANGASDYQAFLRYSFRNSLKADFALKNLGFRCAKGEP